MCVGGGGGGSKRKHVRHMKKNPGPLDPPDVVIKNEDHTVHTRSVLLHSSHFQHQVDG